MLKTIVTAGLLSLGVLVASPVGPVRADTDVNIGIGLGGGYEPEPRYRPVAWSISCGEGQRIVRRNGFRNVRPLDCRGRTYDYIGTRHERIYRITVSARSGYIRDIDRIRRGGYYDDDGGYGGYRGYGAYDDYDDYDDY